MSDHPKLNPETLAIVRESRGLSQTALASKIGVTQPFISQMEKGIRTPKWQMVIRMAETLGCSPLLLGASLQMRELPVTIFRKQSRIPVRETKAIRAKVILYQYRVGRILERCPPRKPQFAVANSPYSNQSPRAIARQLRRHWGIPTGPINNLTELVESKGVLVVPTSLFPGIDALSVHEPQQNLPPMVFMNADVPGDRWRLSLAHELGHLVLRHHLDILPHPKQVEQEAFDFASEFLAPRREIGGHLRHLDMYRLAQLKKHWKISMASLLMRAQETGRTSPTDARWLWIQLRRGGAKDEPVRITREQPGLIKEMAREYMLATRLSSADMSRELHYRRPDEFWEEFGLGNRLRAI